MNAKPISDDELPGGGHYVAISGGVGGAKLALGLARILAPSQLTIVANTGDDFEHFGLHIAPDLDTVMYTLAGLNDTQRGWGLAGESWQCMDALHQLGGETWFRLGDRDLATHLRRTQLLRAGHSLSDVTATLCGPLGVRHGLLPMSDRPVRTIVHTDAGELAFQHYFVREQCRPAVKGFRFEGIDNAGPSDGFARALQRGDLAAVIICPSNPFVSVEPVLRVPGVGRLLRQSAAPLIAVSPIIAGQAIKGPTAKMMAELSLPNDAVAVARYYRSVLRDYGVALNGFVLDVRDEAYAAEVAGLGVQPLITRTLMSTTEDRIELARAVLSFAERRRN